MSNAGQPDPPTTEPPTLEPQHRIRWWLAGLLTVAGVVVIALGHAFAHGFLVVDTKDESYASGVAVNIGTTLLLAAALVLFERALVFTAQRAVQKATAPIRAEAAAARAESRFVRAENAQLTERTAVLESRLLDLDGQLRARADAANQEQARSFASLDETVDRRTVINIMDAASRINALGLHFQTGRSGRVTVPAGTGLDAPRITVEYAIFDEDDWNRADVPTLALSVVGMEHEPIVWGEEDDPLQIFTEVREMLIRGGEAKRTGPLSAEAFFRNLRSTVEQGTLSRSAQPGGWLVATPVLEMIAEDWMITVGGVEVRDRGVVIRPELYPHNVPGQERTSYRVGAAPAELDGSIWDYAAERGSGYFTGPLDEPWSF